MALTYPLGMQIYSGRKFPPVEAQLATIARSDSPMSRPSGRSMMTSKRRNDMLDAHGLSTKSGHFSVAMAESESERVIEIARRLGTRLSSLPI